MEYTNEEATLLCARLLRQGYVKKTEFPTLELDEHLLKEVQDKLAQVGLELVLNTYSSFYAVRFQPKTQETIDQSNNLSLKNSEVAMLVILWCKLILPKRISMETSLKAKEAEFHAASGEASRQNELPLGQPTPEPAMPPLETLSKEEAEIMEKEKKESDKIFVKMKELWAEFGEHFSSKTFFKAVLTRLSRLQFIRIHNEIITEGIFSAAKRRTLGGYAFHRNAAVQKPRHASPSCASSVSPILISCPSRALHSSRSPLAYSRPRVVRACCSDNCANAASATPVSNHA